MVEKQKILVVDDDRTLLGRLCRQMERKGFAATPVATAAEAKYAMEKKAFSHAIVDLKLNGDNGLRVVAGLQRQQPRCRIVMLTGYGNIATAVAAMKAGAVDFLPKPADPDTIYDALMHQGRTIPPPPEKPMSAARVKWEHIQRVYEQCNQNVSETARRLKMHRRTLQRFLSKHAPKP